MSSKEIRELRSKFNERLNAAGAQHQYGTVVKVDEQLRTCDVQVGGIVYEGVLLYACENAELKGFVAIPKQDSLVIVAALAGSSRMYVALFSEIDKVIFTIDDKVTMTCNGEQIEATAPKMIINGGNLGGLINIEPITQKINDLIKAFNNHTHAIEPGKVAVTGTAASQSNPAPVVVPAPEAKHESVNRSDYEDTNVTH